MINAKISAKRRIKEKSFNVFAVSLICRLTVMSCSLITYSLCREWNNVLSKPVYTVLTISLFAVTIVLCSCLRMGREAFFFRLAIDGEGGIKTLFSFFSIKKIPKAVFCRCLYYFVRIIRLAAAELPFIAAVLLLLYLLTKKSIPVQSAVLLGAGCVALLVAGLFYFGVFNSGDILFYRYVTENENISPLEAMKKSRRQMKNRLYGAACFRIKFFPLLLFGVFTLLGSLVYGYFKESCCFYALD